MDYSWALNQTAVYWERLDPDGYGGYDWEDPIEISVRWDDKSEKMVGESGEEFVSKAEILSNQVMKVGDYLYLGDLDSITSASSPSNTKDAYPIQRVANVPDILAEDYVRLAWL